MFALGLITGLVVATLIFAILAFFRGEIERKIKIVETTLYNAGPKPKGYISMPEDESDIIRKEQIEKNRKEGRDTPISELL